MTFSGKPNPGSMFPAAFSGEGRQPQIGTDGLKKLRDLANSARDAAQERIKNNALVGAQEDLDFIMQVAKRVAAAFPYKGKPAPLSGNLKVASTAAAKVKNDYGGDWIFIKDLARLTIAASTHEGAANIFGELRRQFDKGKTQIRATNVDTGESWLEITDPDPNVDYPPKYMKMPEARGEGVAKEPKIIRQAENIGVSVAEYKIISERDEGNESGYTGFALYVRTQSGRTAELQVNSFPVLYAKESTERFAISIGEDVQFEYMEKLKMVGGLGHKLYEDIREGRENGVAAKAASRAYYAYCRSVATGVNLAEREKLVALLTTALYAVDAKGALVGMPSWQIAKAAAKAKAKADAEKNSQK